MIERVQWLPLVKVIVFHASLARTPPVGNRGLGELPYTVT